MIAPSHELHIATVQFNPNVGDVFNNANKMFSLYEKAATSGAIKLVVFPECAISGYPIQDLAIKPDFIEMCVEARQMFIEKVYESGLSAGVIFGSPNVGAKGTTNSAFCVDPIHKDYVVIDKTFLPNYGVFDEVRTFDKGMSNNEFWQFEDLRIGVMICEDAWHNGVISRCWQETPDLIVSINGSPFEVGKNVVRKDVVLDRLEELVGQNQLYKQNYDGEYGAVPFVYVNMVGGQDEIVFDGNSFVIDAKGYRQTTPFVEGIAYFGVNLSQFMPRENDDFVKFHKGLEEFGPIQKLPFAIKTDIEPTGIPEIYQCQVLGTRDFLYKQGFKSVIIGYSGGVDSGDVAAIACDAIGPENVHLVSLPSKFSDDASKDDALEGAKRLGANYRSINIEPVVAALRAAYTGATYPLGGYPALNDKSPILTGVSDENIQARARGTILMAISNQEGHMVLSTGNKSEVSLGFCTIYGDMAGGFNPIKDAYKTTVWECCVWRNSIDPTKYGFLGPKAIVVPQEIIDKIPSAGLAVGQVDPFDYRGETDPILKLLIEQVKSVKEIIGMGFDPDQVARHYRLLLLSEYKRRQSAPGVKITSKLHGQDRRIPITYKEPIKK